MPKIYTLGPQHRRSEFEYDGSVEQGVVIHFENTPSMPVGAPFLRAALRHFKGRAVAGGFRMDLPPAGGFGEWVEQNSAALNGRRLSPRHASFVAAILAHEGHIRSTLEGNRVMLAF